MKIFKTISLALLGLMLVLIGLAAFLLTTQSGLNVLVGQAKNYCPQLSGGDFKGSVLRLDAQKVIWQQSGIRFEGDFGWHLDFKRLFDVQVVLTDFYLKSSRIQVESEKLSQQPTPSANSAKSTDQSGWDLNTPVPIHIEKIAFNDISVDLDGQKLFIESWKSAFHWTEQGIDVPEMGLTGNWQGQPLTVAGSVSSRQAGKLLHLSDVVLSVGNNDLRLKGDVRFHAAVPNLDLSLTMKLTDFSELAPQIKGRLNGRLQLRGPVLMPLINADLSAEGWDLNGIAIKSFRLIGAMGAEENVTGGANLKLTGITLPGLFIDRFSADLSGSQNAHELKIAADASLFKVDATLSGSLNDTMDAWQGKLNALHVRSGYGPVNLVEPMALTFDTNKLALNIGHFCLKHPYADLCLRNDLFVDLLTKKAFNVDIALQKLDLGFIKRYFPGRFEASGRLSAEAQIEVPEGFQTAPNGVLTVNAPPFSTKYMLEQSDFVLNFDKSTLSLAHDGQKINTKWAFRLKGNGELSGDVDIIDPMKQRRLSGTVKVDELSAELFNSLLSPGETAQGVIYGDLRLGGTLTEPLLYGKSGIRNMRVDSTKLPFEMLPSTFALTFDGNQSSLEGELKTPKGGLTLKGDADWKTFAQGHTRIAAKGVKMRVTMPPAVEFDLTTDVQCEASSEKIALNGMIDLPWARVQVYELPASAVDVSDDTVRLDRPRIKKADSSEAIPIESNLFINIGDDVRIDAMGLKARVTGRLHVVQNNGNLGLTGQVTVPRGQFKAYGQDLIVRKGEFMFAGAADNPLINLEAIRNPEKTADDVIAGIRVTGQAEMPEVAIFTEPQKSETESLSYLMRGEGLDPAGEDDNSMITSALINLGLSQGNRVVERLGDAVGISGLGLDTEGVGDSSKVAVSGYILPGLKVKYSVGLFDSLATLTLRYRVIPRLYIEAASGVDQALDVLYSFEF